VHEDVEEAHHEVADEHSTPLFLAAAANKFLDTTVTKFL
jgi:hypothetical protein